MTPASRHKHKAQLRVPAPIVAACEKIAKQRRQVTGEIVLWSDVARELLAEAIQKPPAK